MNTKHISIRDAVRQVLHDNKGTYLSPGEIIDLATDIVAMSEEQVKAACSQLFCQGELTRDGERGDYHYNYKRRQKRKPRADSAKPASLNPIEELLDAMARAEPVLKQLAAAHEALVHAANGGK